MTSRAALVLVTLLATSSVLAERTPASGPDPRCRGGIQATAKRFTQGTPEERYLQLSKACGRDEVLALAKALIAFRTVSADEPKKKAPQFAAMAKHLSGFAKRHGFTFTAHGKNDVFELTWGAGEKKAAFVFHGDVVPAPRDEWRTDPFKAVVRDGRLYGRGAEDDKGPLASALVALAMARASGLEPDGRVMIIVGNGEEHDWAPMIAYAKQVGPIEHVVSVDSTFPVVAAQSGFVAWKLTAKLEPTPAPGAGQDAGAEGAPSEPLMRLVTADAGEFLTQVPGRARMTLHPGALSLADARAEVQRRIDELAKSRSAFKAEVEAKGGHLLVTTHGNAVHASVADQGHNALWELAALASRLPLEKNGLTHVLEVVAQRFDGDHYGKKLGVAYEDSLMGPLLSTPTMLRVKEGAVTLSVNMRRPRGRDAAQFATMLDEAAKAVSDQTGGRVTELKAERYTGEPHTADVSGPLVTTLSEIYQRHRGGDAKSLTPASIRGGTYARLFPRGVDFGPAFPGEPYTGHAPNESISLEGLDTLTQMLSEAVLRLGTKQPSGPEQAPRTAP